jgi:lactoylglutathione lyase
MRIDHAALYCRDLEGMRIFFLKYFDAFSNDKYHNPRTGLSTYILSFNEGSCRLELMNRPDMVETDAAKNNTRFIHLSFSIGSKELVDKKTLEPSKAGYTVVSGPRTTGDGYYESCILGPEHIQIEVTV